MPKDSKKKSPLKAQRAAGSAKKNGTSLASPVAPPLGQMGDSSEPVPQIAAIQPAGQQPEAMAPAEASIDSFSQPAAADTELNAAPPALAAPQLQDMEDGPAAHNSDAGVQQQAPPNADEEGWQETPSRRRRSVASTAAIPTATAAPGAGSARAAAPSAAAAARSAAPSPAAAAPTTPRTARGEPPRAQPQRAAGTARRAGRATGGAAMPTRQPRAVGVQATMPADVVEWGKSRTTVSFVVAAAAGSAWSITPAEADRIGNMVGSFLRRVLAGNVADITMARARVIRKGDGIAQIFVDVTGSKTQLADVLAVANSANEVDLAPFAGGGPCVARVVGQDVPIRTRVRLVGLPPQYGPHRRAVDAMVQSCGATVVAFMPLEMYGFVESRAVEVVLQHTGPLPKSVAPLDPDGNAVLAGDLVELHIMLPKLDARAAAPATAGAANATPAAAGPAAYAAASADTPTAALAAVGATAAGPAAAGTAAAATTATAATGAAPATTATTAAPPPAQPGPAPSDHAGPSAITLPATPADGTAVYLPLPPLPLPPPMPGQPPLPPLPPRALSVSEGGAAHDRHGVGLAGTRRPSSPPPAVPCDDAGEVAAAAKRIRMTNPAFSHEDAVRMAEGDQRRLRQSELEYPGIRFGTIYH